MGATAILGKIFGTGKVVEEGIKLIDSIHVSDTELIEAKAKAKVDLIQAYAPFKLAQRYLALMFAVTFLTCFVLVLVLTMTGKGSPLQVQTVMGEFYIAEIMFTIIVFYFGGGFLEGSIEAVRKRK